MKEEKGEGKKRKKKENKKKKKRRGTRQNKFTCAKLWVFFCH